MLLVQLLPQHLDRLIFAIALSTDQGMEFLIWDLGFE